MTPEQICFLRLLQDYVHQRPSVSPSEEINWNQIVQYARDQSLGGIIYVQCRSFMPQKSYPLKLLHKNFYSEVYESVNSQAALEEIEKKFEEEGVSCMPFKGSVVQQYYPDSELRTMGDRDVLIHHEDREIADRIVCSLGYKKFVDNHAVWTYFKGTTMFEVHDVMFYEYLSNQVNYREYFNHIWDTAVSVNSNGVYTPEVNRHFLYLVCHMAKHIVNNGMGFRAFLDMVFMLQNEKKLDWDWIAAELEQLKLLDFTKTCFALCERWFDVHMPFFTAVLDEGFYHEVTVKVFCDGIFGLHNEQNEAAHSAKEIKRSEQAYWRTAVTLTWKKLFPPYEDMQLIPWYKFLDGRPWLLPVAWIYRWLYTGKYKFKQSKDLLMEPFAKRGIIEKREKFIDSWGL